MGITHREAGIGRFLITKFRRSLISHFPAPVSYAAQSAPQLAATRALLARARGVDLLGARLSHPALQGTVAGSTLPHAVLRATRKGLSDDRLVRLEEMAQGFSRSMARPPC